MLVWLLLFRTRHVLPSGGGQTEVQGPGLHPETNDETPGTSGLIGILEKIGNDLAEDIANMLQDEHASIRTDD